MSTEAIVVISAIGYLVIAGIVAAVVKEVQIHSGEYDPDDIISDGLLVGSIWPVIIVLLIVWLPYRLTSYLIRRKK